MKIFLFQIVFHWQLAVSRVFFFLFQVVLSLVVCSISARYFYFISIGSCDKHKFLIRSIVIYFCFLFIKIAFIIKDLNIKLSLKVVLSQAVCWDSVSCYWCQLALSLAVWCASYFYFRQFFPWQFVVSQLVISILGSSFHGSLL